MTVGVLSIVLLGSSELMVKLFTASSVSEETFWVEARRLQIQNTLKSPNAWADIVLNNSPGLACLTNGGCSAYTAPQPLQLPIDGQVLAGSNAALGIARDGTFCNSFDAVNGNDACPYGLTLRYQILCESGACKSPQPKFTVDFSKRAKTAQAVTPLTALSLRVYKDTQLETLDQVCASMGGVLSGTGAGTESGTNCTIAALNTTCDASAGEFVLGFDGAGRAICGRPTLASCAGTNVVTGYDAAGGTICGPGCP